MAPPINAASFLKKKLSSIVIVIRVAVLPSAYNAPAFPLTPKLESNTQDRIVIPVIAPRSEIAAPLFVFPVTISIPWMNSPDEPGATPKRSNLNPLLRTNGLAGNPVEQSNMVFPQPIMLIFEKAVSRVIPGFEQEPYVPPSNTKFSPVPSTGKHPAESTELRGMPDGTTHVFAPVQVNPTALQQAMIAPLSVSEHVPGHAGAMTCVVIHNAMINSTPVTRTIANSLNFFVQQTHLQPIYTHPHIYYHTNANPWPPRLLVILLCVWNVVSSIHSTPCSGGAT